MPLSTSNSNGTSSDTAPTATTGPPPPRVTAAGNCADEIDLGIAADAAASAMQILRNGSLIYSGGVISTFADTGMSADSSYTYTVITSNTDGSSATSATGASGPSAPGVVATAAGPHEIDLAIAPDPPPRGCSFIATGF